MTGPSPSPSLQARLSSALAGRYVIERELGAGGMGTVFLARDATLERPVAIKVISPDVAGSAELRQRFLLEARTVARLRHPNIVSVYSAGEDDGLLWFAMEFVPGESLRDRLQREPVMDADDVALIMHDLALALDDAHAAGIVHRDVKPENILLDRETGRAMLTDFGVARALTSSDARLTGMGFVLGSPRYMSPEQASGEPTIDGRSDLYSLGLVAWEMLAGRPVITAETPATILVKHLTEDATPIATLAPSVPPLLADAIMRSLRKSPDERFARGRALADALEGRESTDGSTSGRRPSPLAGSGATRRATASAAPAAKGGRNWLPAALGGVAVAAAAGWYAMLGGPAPSTADTRTWLIAPFELQTSNASLDWLREGAVNMLGLTLSQWNDLSVVDYERTLDLMRDVREEDQRRLGLDAARGLARRVKAGAVIMGQITTANDSLFVVARRYDVTSGDRIDEARAGAPLSGDPRLLFERLAKELLDLAGGPALTLELAQQTTASVEAYRLYLDGLRALNSFRLPEADVLFERAIALDTTFALAYYKRSLGLGWSNRLDSTYVKSAEGALRFGERMPPRMREVFAGNLDLSRGFLASMQGKPDEARTHWNAAQQRFATLVASDSSDFEAWYGLGDADFHAATGTNITAPDSIALLLNRSLQAFERTVALDSSFHLSYAHLVSLYQTAASPRSPLVLDGGRLQVASGLRDTTRIGALRREAQERTRRFAERWVAEEPDGAQAWQALLNTYAVLQQWDSAALLIGRMKARPAVYSPSLALTRPFYRLLIGEMDSIRGDLMDVFTRFPAESLGVRSTTPPVMIPFVGMTPAGAIGAVGLLDSLVELAVAQSPTIPISGTPSRATTEWYANGVRIAMGVPVTPAVQAQLRNGTALLSNLTAGGSFAQQLRAQSLGVPYSAYLITRDTVFSSAVLKWVKDAGGQWRELEALVALDRGDSTLARAGVSAFADTTGMTTATVSLGGARVIARAEILTRLGEPARAVALLEALRPQNFSVAMAEPGYALYIRSRLTLGKLHEQLGQRDRALAAYTAFEQHWRNADPSLQGELREARAAIQRLRDGGTNRTIPTGAAPR
jgi:serine/threonine-protein kinase